MPRALDSIYFSIIPADTQGPCRILAVRVLFRKKRKKCLTKGQPSGILCLADGRLAQLARASAWRAEGHRFESYIVHHEKTLFCLPRQGRLFFAFWVNTGRIIKKRALERSIGYSEARFLRSAAEIAWKRRCAFCVSLLCKERTKGYKKQDSNLIILADKRSFWKKHGFA